MKNTFTTVVTKVYKEDLQITLEVVKGIKKKN